MRGVVARAIYCWRWPPGAAERSRSRSCRAACGRCHWAARASPRRAPGTSAHTAATQTQAAHQPANRQLPRPAGQPPGRAPVSEQALGRAVPARRDVLCVGLLAVDAPAAAKVRQLEAVVHDQDVLRLDVPVQGAAAGSAGMRQAQAGAQQLARCASCCLATTAPAASWQAGAGSTRSRRLQPAQRQAP